MGTFLCGPSVLATVLSKKCAKYSDVDPRKTKFYFNKENFWVENTIKETTFGHFKGQVSLLLWENKWQRFPDTWATDGCVGHADRCVCVGHLHYSGTDSFLYDETRSFHCESVYTVRYSHCINNNVDRAFVWWSLRLDRLDYICYCDKTPQMFSLCSILVNAKIIRCFLFL